MNLSASIQHNCLIFNGSAIPLSNISRIDFECYVGDLLSKKELAEQTPFVEIYLITSFPGSEVSYEDDKTYNYLALTGNTAQAIRDLFGYQIEGKQSFGKFLYGI